MLCHLKLAQKENHTYIFKHEPLFFSHNPLGGLETCRILTSILPCHTIEYLRNYNYVRPLYQGKGNAVTGTCFVGEFAKLRSRQDSTKTRKYNHWVGLLKLPCFSVKGKGDWFLTKALMF